MQTRQAMGTEAIVEILREWLDVHAPFKGRRGEPR
jgi:hypothetical protein